MRSVASTTDADYSAIHAEEHMARPHDDFAQLPYAGAKGFPRRHDKMLTEFAFAVAITTVQTPPNPASAALSEQWAASNQSGAESSARQNVISEDRNAERATEILGFANLPEGWDGPGSIAPSRAAVADALAFLDLLPPNADLAAMASADGEVGFYKRTADSYIDIGFRGDGRMSYFARSRGEKAKDVAAFGRRSIPKDLLDVISLT